MVVPEPISNDDFLQDDDLTNKLEAYSRAARPHRQLAKPAI
jgi:hypothetical protein